MNKDKNGGATVQELLPHDNSPLMAYCDSLRDDHRLNGRLLFVQIPQVILDSFNYEVARRGVYYNFPPTGIQCLYEAVKDRGLEIDILDLNFELMKRVHDDPEFQHDQWYTILEEKLDTFQPGIIALSCLFDVGIAPMLKALEIIRSRGDAVAIGGGVIATYEWKSLLDDGLCHFVVEGEGENKLNFLLDALTGESKNQPPTPGIHFRIGDEFLESQGAPDIVDYSGDLIDSYKLVPVEDYFKYGSLNPFSREHAKDSPFAAIQFARGCRAACTFCAVRDFVGKGVRHRPIEDVLAEMEFLITERGVRHFEWLDDDPTFYHEEFKEMLRRIIGKGWKIHWSTNNGIIGASVDEELLGLMRDSGCVGFKIGIETGNAEILKKVRKPATHDKIRRFAKMLKGYPEIFVGGNFIVGLPEEKFYQMMDSFKFGHEIGLDWSATTVCQMIRGASAFSDSGEYFESQMKSKGSQVDNFIPSRHSEKGQMKLKDGLLQGLDIFKLDPDVVPSKDQVKEIWFAFNLIGNYIYNKNLKPGGNAEKFISWVENAQKAYPTNPYMSLFLSLAYRIRGNGEKADQLAQDAERDSQNEYWNERFEEFGLKQLLKASPKTTQDVFDLLLALQSEIYPSFRDWMEVPYGNAPGDERERLGA